MGEKHGTAQFFLGSPSLYHGFLTLLAILFSVVVPPHPALTEFSPPADEDLTPVVYHRDRYKESRELHEELFTPT
jgi:hypothetical protein